MQVRRHAELAYAGNVHVAQSRTVDTTHLVVDDTAWREAFYVGMGRARQRNTAYVITERVRAADLSPELRPAPSLEDPGAAGDAPPRPHRLAVLAGVLERQQSARTATESVRRDLDRAASLATLAPAWADVTRAHATRRHEKTIRSLLAPEDWQQYQQDTERGTLTRLLRAADLAGHDAEEVLRRALEGRDFAGARSVAAVLHGRVQRITGTPEPQAAAGYADRTPAIEDPDADRFARELATAMDQRVALLGNQVTVDRPVWALRYLGEVPADPVERAEWTGRAGTAAAYREERGYADEIEAIGRRWNADHRNREPAGTRPMSRWSCLMNAGRSRRRPTVSCGHGVPRTSGTPGGRRLMSLTSSGMLVSRRTPTALMPCSYGTGPTPHRMKPSGQALCGKQRNTVRWRRRSAPTGRPWPK